MLSEKKTIFKNEMFIVYAVSFFVLVLHLYSNAFANYGIFRDEFYYIACSNRLDIGYVDQPPFSIYILAISRFLFGDSLFAIRLIPAFASAFTVFFTGLVIKRIGGGRTALWVGLVSVALVPIFLGISVIYSMNSLSILMWIIASYILLMIIENPIPKYWIILGIVIGTGLLNKIDFFWFGAGLFMALILTEQRKHLKTIWPYITAAIALLIFLPYIVWNIQNNFAHLEFIHNASQGKYSSLSRTGFIISNFLILNPISALVWIPGIYYYFFYKDRKKYRPLGIIFLTAFAILMINSHSKAEYLAAAYPVLFAAGGLMIEYISKKRFMGWSKYAVVTLILITGIAFLPFVMPILPVQSYIDYSNYLGQKPSSPENKRLSELPQFYADMFGWEEMAQSVSNVYKMIPPEERNKTLCLAQNYGEAGAIEYYKSKYDLPPAAAFHNNYWIWGREEVKKDYKVFIVIGGRLEDHLRSCEIVEQVYLHTAKYSMPYENKPIYICKKLKRNLNDIWENERHYE